MDARESLRGFLAKALVEFGQLVTARRPLRGVDTATGAVTVTYAFSQSVLAQRMPLEQVSGNEGGGTAGMVSPERQYVLAVDGLLWTLGPGDEIVDNLGGGGVPYTGRVTLVSQRALGTKYVAQCRSLRE